MGVIDEGQLNSESTRSIIREELTRFAECTLQNDLLAELRSQVRQDLCEELRHCGIIRPDPFLRCISPGNDEEIDHIAKGLNENVGYKPGTAPQLSSDRDHVSAVSPSSTEKVVVSVETETRLMRHLAQGRPLKQSDRGREDKDKPLSTPDAFSSGMNSPNSRAQSPAAPPAGMAPPLPPMPNWLPDADDTEGHALQDNVGQVSPVMLDSADNNMRFLDLQKGRKEKKVAQVIFSETSSDEDQNVRIEDSHMPAHVISEDKSAPDRQVSHEPRTELGPTDRQVSGESRTELPPDLPIEFVGRASRKSLASQESDGRVMFRTETTRLGDDGWLLGSGSMGMVTQRSEGFGRRTYKKQRTTRKKMTVGRALGGTPEDDCATQFDTLSEGGPAEKAYFQTSLREAILNPIFECAIGILLALNALSIGFRAQHRAKHPTGVLPGIHGQVELVFSVLFTIEILLKLYAFRTAFFKTKGWQWNAFDLVVVVIQDAELILDLSLQGNDGKLEELSFTRLLRLGRVVRLLRMVRLIPELKSIVSLVAASMSAFLWTMVLLMLLLYGVAVHLTEVVADFVGSTSIEVPELQSERLEGAWGSLPQSIVSLYEAILGGIDWKDLMDDLEDINWSVPLIFMMYIAFGVLVMLNLVTGVFVEGAQRIVSDDRDAELVKQAHKVFASVDESDHNVIDWAVFKRHLDDTSMHAYFTLLGMHKSDAKDLFRLLDLDGSGSLSIKEFVHGCLSLRGTAKSLDLARIAYNFELVDKQVKAMDNKLTRLLGRASATDLVIESKNSQTEPLRVRSECTQ